MSDDERPSIQSPLEIYARRGWVAQEGVLALLFAIFLLGVALFNLTGRDAQRVPAALLAAFFLYLGVEVVRSGRRPILRLDRETLTCRWSPLWISWWRPKRRFARELAVRWSDLRRISIVQMWPSGFGLIVFYVRADTPGVAPPRWRRDSWPAFALFRRALDFPESSLEQVIASHGGPPVDRRRSLGRQRARGW